MGPMTQASAQMTMGNQTSNKSRTESTLHRPPRARFSTRAVLKPNKPTAIPKGMNQGWTSCMDSSRANDPFAGDIPGVVRPYRAGIKESAPTSATFRIGTPDTFESVSSAELKGGQSPALPYQDFV